MRSVRWMSVVAPLTAMAGFLFTATFIAPSAQADVVIHDEQTSSPIVLDQAEDYLLRKVYVSGVRDGAALTLAGRIDSVRLENCRFGDVCMGVNGHAAALEATGARIGSFIATDTAFYDSENQLVSLRDGSFGTVTFLHCTFKNSEAALRKMSMDNPWRTTLPTTEFFNIDRLELLDNEYVNTTLVIQSSVKTVVFRGDLSKLRIQSPDTQVLHLEPGQDPFMALPPGTEVLASIIVPPEDRPTATPTAKAAAPEIIAVQASQSAPVRRAIATIRSDAAARSNTSKAPADARRQATEASSPPAHAVP